VTSGGNAAGSIEGGAIAAAGGALRNTNISVTAISQRRCTAGHSVHFAAALPVLAA